MPKICPKIFALDAIIPGQPKPMKVEKINHIGKYFAILANPTKILSPLTSAYRSISMFMMNWKEMPRMAPHIIPKPKFEARYGQRIISPNPNPKPKIIKLGPKIFKNDDGGSGKGVFLKGLRRSITSILTK